MLHEFAYIEFFDSGMNLQIPILDCKGVWNLSFPCTHDTPSCLIRVTTTRDDPCFVVVYHNGKHKRAMFFDHLCTQSELRIELLHTNKIGTIQLEVHKGVLKKWCCKGWKVGEWQNTISCNYLLSADAKGRYGS